MILYVPVPPQDAGGCHIVEEGFHVCMGACACFENTFTVHGSAIILRFGNLQR